MNNLFGINHDFRTIEMSDCEIVLEQDAANCKPVVGGERDACANVGWLMFESRDLTSLLPEFLAKKAIRML